MTVFPSTTLQLPNGGQCKDVNLADTGGRPCLFIEAAKGKILECVVPITVQL